MSLRTSTRTAARPHTAWRGSAPILAASVMWGSSGTISSLAPAGAPAAAIGSAGLALGGLLLYATGRGNRQRPATPEPRNGLQPRASERGDGLTRRSFTASGRGGRLRLVPSERGLLLVGALAVAGYPVTYYPAVARTGVAVATVIALGSAPIFAGLLSWLTGRGRPTPRWCLATLLAVIGCALLVVGPELGAAGTTIDPLGVLLAACGGLVYAVYSQVGGVLIARGHDSNTVMGNMFGLAAVLALPVVVLSGPAWLATPRGLAVAAHLAVFTTFLAYRLFGYGLRHTTVETATALTLVEPAVAALLGVTVVGERLPVLSWSGLAVLALGLAMLTLPTRIRDAHAASASGVGNGGAISAT